MQKQSGKILLFLMVLISYMALVGISIYSYVDVDEDLPHDLPNLVLLIPAVITFMIPLTYGLLLFAIPENPRPASTVLLGSLMAIGLIGLSVAVRLFAES